MTTPDFATIAVSVDGAVGRVSLNRPDKLNPLGVETLDELRRAARWFDEQPETKVVVVQGEG
ncbi:MAG: enoyl-CoA hydratase/isomerase family protein, partial [Acidimicrobiia bacterium]|nr:enoyl-CoA hydratase/isomerase family protein [Acidimicrobiia bacterium]